MVSNPYVYGVRPQNLSSLAKSGYQRAISNDFEINEMYLSQAYYWTKEWQDGEKEADGDIKHGRVKNFKNAKDTIQYLRSKRK